MIGLWGCLTVAGLLLAGCSFKPGGSASDHADASGGGPVEPDAGPTIDGGSLGPDAAPPGPDAEPIVPVLLETLIVPASGEVVPSDTTLSTSASYTLIASGTLVARTEEGNYTADADYVWADDLPGVRLDSFDGVDLGLAVDDTVVDGTRSPDWGAFSSSHSYTFVMGGTGATLTAQFHDPNYDNGNSGSLTLEIWGPP